MTYAYNVAYTSTGDITQLRYEERDILNSRIAKNENVLEVENPIDIESHKVDVSSKSIIMKTPEELSSQNYIEPFVPNLEEVFNQEHS